MAETVLIWIGVGITGAVALGLAAMIVIAIIALIKITKEM